MWVTYLPKHSTNKTLLARGTVSNLLDSMSKKNAMMLWKKNAMILFVTTQLKAYQELHNKGTCFS